MSKGYHQLKKSSKNKTTFLTHIGLYRCKRLNYGTRSAAKIFQETIIEELTQDLKGVFNISDDIIVHRCDTKKHGANMEALLKKRREKNVTFKKGKCKFNKERMVYYFYLFFYKHNTYNTISNITYTTYNAYLHYSSYSH